MSNRDLQNDIYRAKFKADHGYDPGNYGEFGGEMLIVLIIVILFVVNYFSS